MGKKSGKAMKNLEKTVKESGGGVKGKNKLEEKVETIAIPDEDIQEVESDSIPIIEDPFPTKKTLRIGEVAQFWDVTERTVRLWVDHGHLTMIETPGGQKRITKESFDRCIFAKNNT